MTTPNPAYFTAEGETYHPTERARGWWKHDSLQGRAVVALLGRTLDRREGDPALIPARMTVDIHGMPPFAPVTVATRTLEASRRLRVAEAVLRIGGEAYARARCQFLRPGEPPAGDNHSHPGWSAPHPDTLPSEPVHERAIAETKLIVGHMGSPLPRQCWLRERQDIVAGETRSAWEWLAGCADFASPWAHMEGRLGYINTDVTTMIHRLPVSEWIGFEATGHDAGQGIAVGHCRLFDTTGPIGFVATTAVSMARKR